MVTRGYVDLEFGQVYGSYRRDFVPVEAGLLVYDRKSDSIDLDLKRFPFRGDLVMRINSIDSMGNPVGLRERVLDPSTGEYSDFDPRYRIRREHRNEKETEVHRIFKSLSGFLKKNIKEHKISQLVFFGCAEDVNLIRRSGFGIGRYERLDVQRELRPHLGADLSLDKASIIIDFRTEGKKMMSRHFTYTVPDGYHDELIPHNAIGDVSRIFMLHREMTSYRSFLLSRARDHLKKIEDYREDEREIPLF